MNKYIINIETTIEAADILQAIEIGQNIASKCVTGAYLKNMIEIKESQVCKSQTSEPNNGLNSLNRKATPERIS